MVQSPDFSRPLPTRTVMVQSPDFSCPLPNTYSDGRNLQTLGFSRRIHYSDGCSSGSGGGGGGVGGLTPPPSEVVFFCLSVYENSHGPGP